ncbi:MAG: hypothetical protein AB7E69_10180 [Sphingomonadales bacterium]
MATLLALASLAATPSAGEGAGFATARPSPDIGISASPPAPALAEEEQFAVVLFHGGALELDVEEDGVRSKVKGLLRVPLDGREHRLNATYVGIDGLPDTLTIAVGQAADGTRFVRVDGNGSVLAEDRGMEGNLFAEVEDNAVQRANWNGFSNFSGSSWLGYGSAARWRLRSVPAGAQVSILDRLVSTDVDIARLESKYIRALTFSKPGYQPCGFTDARISQEETAGLSWTVITCVLKKTGP